MGASRTRTRGWVRNLDAWDQFELFLVAAVAAILCIRLFLEITGYPKLGGGRLHIAHMLWGGLLMQAALLLFLTFLNRAAHRAAAVIGGLGFGTFIDEVGKFVTADNNYFFRPAAALMYITFVLTFLVVHLVRTHWEYSPDEYLMNALKQMEEVALHSFAEEDRQRALLYLEKCDSGHPLVPVLRRLAEEAPAVEQPRAGPLLRTKARLRSFYRWMATLPGFPAAVTAFFVLQLMVTVIYVLLSVAFFGLGWDGAFQLRGIHALASRLESLSVVDATQLGSSLLAGVFTALGVIRLRRSRFAAFEMFERSILVSILLTQFFSFYRHQFSALLGLALDILILFAVRFVKEQERLAAAPRMTPGRRNSLPGQ